MSEDSLRRAIGCADACELLFLAFSFPSDDLALALADGRFFSIRTHTINPNHDILIALIYQIILNIIFAQKPN